MKPAFAEKTFIFKPALAVKSNLAFKLIWLLSQGNWPLLTILATLQEGFKVLDELGLSAHEKPAPSEITLALKSVLKVIFNPVAESVSAVSAVHVPTVPPPPTRVNNLRSSK